MSRNLAVSELERFPELDWFTIAPRIRTELRVILERMLEARDASWLTHHQCLQLANAEGDDLLGLLVAAIKLGRW